MVDKDIYIVDIGGKHLLKIGRFVFHFAKDCLKVLYASGFCVRNWLFSTLFTCLILLKGIGF